MFMSLGKNDSCDHEIQGGEETQDALSSRSLSAKEPPNVRLFCEKRPIKIRGKRPIKIMSSRNTGRRRGIRCFIFIRLFPQKSPIISGYFAERDVQLKETCVVLSPCNHVLPRLNGRGGDEPVKECQNCWLFCRKRPASMHLRHPVTISATTQRHRKR